MTPDKIALLRTLIAANGGEALFRPSSADRVIGCVGSTVLIARTRASRPPERPSQYALEGTAAHIVVQEALLGRRQPDEWTDRMVRISDTDGWFVDEEMVDAADTYLGVVASREGPGTERFIEHRLSLAPLDPSDPLLGENRGTADCLIVDRPRRRLTVVDLKYGKGVMVASDAQQLQDYALMALVSLGLDGGWDEVETKVVQPRAPDWERRSKDPPTVYRPAELLNGFLPTLVDAMEAALDPAARLTPNEKWCRWCPARDACPALADRAFNVARDAFTAAPLHDASSAAAVAPAEVLAGTVENPRPASAAGIGLPSPLSLDPADVATILDRRPLYDTFIEGVERRAVQLIQAGVVVPGWAMKPRTGNRRFKDTEAAAAALRGMGLQTAAIYTEPKLKSPAQIEKLLPEARRGPFDPANAETLVERPEGEPALVKADPKRLSSASGFTPISAKAEG